MAELMRGVMDVVIKFITDKSILGILQKGVLVLFGFFIAVIRKLTTLRQDMETLKLTIDEDKEQTTRDRTLAREYMEDALRYRNEARTDRTATEQIREAAAQDREEIAKKAIAIDSLLSSAQERNIIDTIGTETSEDANTEILKNYLES